MLGCTFPGGDLFNRKRVLIKGGYVKYTKKSIWGGVLINGNEW